MRYEPGGNLPRNIAHFGRLLRRAGLSIGPGQIAQAIEAAAAVGVTRRTDFYFALRTSLVVDHRDASLFDEAFAHYFRDPFAFNQALDLLTPTVTGSQDRRDTQTRRLYEAWSQGRIAPTQNESPRQEEVEFEVALAASATEKLSTKDFEQMSAAEIQEALEALRSMPALQHPLSARRYRPSTHGARIDLAATLRAGLRSGGKDLPLRRRTQRTRPAPLVVLCDISGSMGRYSRMLLHFVHALTRHQRSVHTFAFGTRLTPITRELRQRDVDQALRRVGQAVVDWSGGTLLGPCLKQFNFEWARRVLGGGATVLLVTDGLERGEQSLLEGELARLRRFARRLIWLNPLLRWREYEAVASGPAALLRVVDDARPVHNLESLRALARALQ